LFVDFQSLISRIVSSYLFGIIQIGISEYETDVSHFDKLLAPKIFSDSIFIPTIDDSEQAFAQLSTICSIIMARSLSIGLTCRGAISKGQTFLDPQLNIILGKSVVQSHELASQIQTFGVAIDPAIKPNPDYVTKPILVDVKIKNQLKKKRLHFTKVGAFLPHHSFDINRTYPIEKYLELQTEYANRDKAEQKIISRFSSGLKVLKEVLK
ncbi:MAG: hypothetical protein KJ941_03380, partial [Bacteroidetes bacterium]|nr:hypothetical protein [Bacteroidota bacterium]